MVRCLYRVVLFRKQYPIWFIVIVARRRPSDLSMSAYFDVAPDSADQSTLLTQKLAESQSVTGPLCFFRRTLHNSPVRDVVVCPTCKLSQFESGNDKCLRCHRSLGITYIEIFPSGPHARLDCRCRVNKSAEIGKLIRRLRLRRGITQAALASRTGIHRTYLSRAECGRVIPSILALMEIANVLGIDKIMLRVRSRAPNRA